MSTDLARHDGRDDLPSEQASAAITGALEGLKAIRTFVKQQFKPGIDAGVIPGCGDKPTLFLPGAQKATMYFNAFPTFKVRETDLGNGHVEYRVRCLLMSRASGHQIGEGLGCCSTKEKKYKRGGAAKLCPSCGVAAINKSKEEYGGGWYCNAKAGGCGAKFSKTHKGLAEARAVEVADDSAYEVRNTVLKMAKKRAHVDAAMTLGCLSELFTQDIEDTYRLDDLRALVPPEAAEPYHIDGEIIDPPPQPSARGLFTKEHVELTRKFNEYMASKCEKTNAAWVQEWESRATDAMEDGLEFPAKIDPVINPWQAKAHLLKWAVEVGMIDPDLKAEAAKTRQTDAYVAMLFYRSEQDKAAIKAEMGHYVAEQRRLKSDAIYRKFPDLAPAGYLEEQHEAAGHDDAEPNGEVAPVEPRDGRWLFAWAKDQEDANGVGLIKYLGSWGKLQEFPRSITDWDARQVELGHAEALSKLRSLALSEQDHHAVAEAGSNA